MGLGGFLFLASVSLGCGLSPQISVYVFSLALYLSKLLWGSLQVTKRSGKNKQCGSGGCFRISSRGLSYKRFPYSWVSGFLEKELAPHSSIPSWKVPWMEESGGLQSIGLERIGNK